MVKDSINLIKAQNATIESALTQNHKWKGDIEDAATDNRQQINKIKEEKKRVLSDIAKIQESCQKMQQEADDLTSEINYSTQREKMFKS